MVYKIMLLTVGLANLLGFAFVALSDNISICKNKNIESNCFQDDFKKVS